MMIFFKVLLLFNFHAFFESIRGFGVLGIRNGLNAGSATISSGGDVWLGGASNVGPEGGQIGRAHV